MPISSIDSLCIVLYANRMCACQEQFQRTWLHPHGNCRHGLASDHTHWLARPVPSWSWHVWFDPRPPSLETGDVILTQAGRDSATSHSSYISHPSTFCLYFVGVHFSAFEPYFTLTGLYIGSPTELDSCQILDQFHSVRLLLSVRGDFWFFIPFYLVVVCEPQPHHIDNRCHANASISSRLRLRVV